MVSSAGSTPSVSRAEDATRLALRLSLSDPEAMRNLCGERDGNLRHLEQQLRIGVLARGEDLHLSGDREAVRIAADVLRALFTEAQRGEEIDLGLVDAVLQLHRPVPAVSVRHAVADRLAERAGAAPKATPAALLPATRAEADSGLWRPGKAWRADEPPEPPLASLGSLPVLEGRPSAPRPSRPVTQMLTQSAHRGRNLARQEEDSLDGLRTVQAWTPGQQRYLEAIAQHDVVLALGPAGTGKTWLAVAAALAALQRREVRRIVLTRPAVEAGENLGFLPGDLQEKVSPYLRPLYDALKDLIDPDKVTRLLERGQIEAAPLAFMRGRTLSSAFVILDEAQNTTPEQMLMLLTRLGEHTKMVVCGDPDQTDLRYGQQSGLAHAQRVLQGVEGIGLVQLDRSDVVRHPLVGRILQAYDVDRANRPANQTGNRYGDRNAERRGG
jgi:phosphate starvation-inducible PhoH-like protein